MSTTDSIRNRASDANEQIAQLRAQVEALMNDRVAPAFADAAHRAEYMARNATDIARDQASNVSAQVRKQPLMAVLIVGVAGFLIGRLFR